MTPPSDAPDHRRLVLLRGAREETADRAADLVGDVPADRLLWVSDTRDAPEDATFTRSSRTGERLGESYDAVVVDTHDRVRADVFGQCHGFVWGGGTLFVRMPPPGEAPTEARERLTPYPHTPDDVGLRFWRRFAARLAEGADPPRVQTALDRCPTGTDDQRRTVERLVQLGADEGSSLAAVVSDRGRGKSAAVGLALAELADRDAIDSAAVTAARPASAAELFRFAAGSPQPPREGRIRWYPARKLVRGAVSPDLVAVDEAAQLSVARLRQLVDRHPESTLIFASTAHGYEGTGRGFALRFLEWLSQRDRPFVSLELEEPIRWAPEDPVEQTAFDALLLDAEPPPFDGAVDASDARHVRLDRGELVRDERRLREFFGLLVQAHYRTTPRDLHRMLDAPNLDLHALEIDGEIAAATWIAREGWLSPKLSDDLYWGRTRILGHALPETFVGHLGHRGAGPFDMIRSVRIAVHPGLRRRGLGTRLVDAVHCHYDPDLFGTLFGAEPGLIAFRRSVGYDLVRLGASRDPRTGSPSVAMARPVSDRARSLVGAAGRELARKLPRQIELLDAGEGPPLEEDLRQTLDRRLPEPEPITADRRRSNVVQYAWGPRTHASAVASLEAFVDRHAEALSGLRPKRRTLIDSRIVRREPWERVRDRTDCDSVPAAMRALRRSVRSLVEQTAPGLVPDT